MQRIEVDGLSIAYHRFGSGPPIVLVHGYVGDAWSTWRPQLEALSDEFNVVAYDLPGAGESSDPPEGFGITGYAGCLSRFVDALALGPVHLAGLSMGGTIAIEAVRQTPWLARSLVLVSAYAGWYGSLPKDIADRRLQQALRLSELTAREFVATLLPTMFASAPAGEHADAFRAVLLAFHPSGFRALARALAVDVSDALGAISIPTLLIYGENDERAPLQVADRMHQAITASKLVMLPRVGHLGSIEAPAEVNREIREFVLANSVP